MQIITRVTTALALVAGLIVGSSAMAGDTLPMARVTAFMRSQGAEAKQQCEKLKSPFCPDYANGGTFAKMVPRRTVPGNPFSGPFKVSGSFSIELHAKVLWDNLLLASSAKPGVMFEMHILDNGTTGKPTSIWVSYLFSQQGGPENKSAMFTSSPVCWPENSTCPVSLSPDMLKVVTQIYQDELRAVYEQSVSPKQSADTY